MKKLPEGWMVYSVGSNGVDDGGKPRQARLRLRPGRAGSGEPAALIASTLLRWVRNCC